MCKIAMVLLHPVTPTNVERLAEDLKLSKDVFSWDNITAPIYDFVEDKDNYRPKFIEARYDFFSKPACQLVKEE